MRALPDLASIYGLIHATWPPAGEHATQTWFFRTGQGGGSRVSAATALAPVTDADITQAEAVMRGAGQTPLFMIRAEDAALDALLAVRGYAQKDITNIYAAPVAKIATTRPPDASNFAVWPPLAAQTEIWAAGGIGDARLAVMDRAQGPKTSILGRVDDHPAGTAFVAISAGCAMLHALEIATTHRRKGLARLMTRAAAFWAQDNGATVLALVTTQANAAANALYTSLGMTHVGQYHYRKHPE